MTVNIIPLYQLSTYITSRALAKPPQNERASRLVIKSRVSYYKERDETRRGLSIIGFLIAGAVFISLSADTYVLSVQQAVWMNR